MDIETKLKEIYEEQNKLLADLQKKYEDQVNQRVNKADFEEFQRKIDKRWDELTAEILKLKAPVKTESQPTDQEKVLFKKAVFFKALAGRPLSPEEQKVLTLSDDAQAGYLAGPPEYAREIIKGVTEKSPIRQIARVKQTGATSYQIPVRTGRMSASRTAEILTRTETGNLQYGLKEMSLPEAYALGKVSRQLLEDSLFNLEAEINQEIIEQFEVLEGREFLTGTGAGEPEGILKNAAVVAAALETAEASIVADDLVGLQYKLDSQYVRNARWLMHRQTAKAIRLLKENTTNAYIWQPGLQASEPPALLGSPVVECPDMPKGQVSGQLEVAYGDFSAGYLIVDRISIEIQRLNELFALNNQVGFLARRRYNGMVVLPEAIRVLKIK